MSYRKMLKSKIHRAHITDANLDYEGSISIPNTLLLLADIIPNEAVQIWNISSGTRFETYAIAGYSNPSAICVNGAAAHLVTPGDIIIIASFIDLEEEKVRSYQPTILFVDNYNQVIEQRAERNIYSDIDSD